MKIHRFIGDFDLTKPELEISGKVAHQMIKVLKLKIGEKIELSDGKHISAMAEICNIDKNVVSVKILNLEALPPSGGKASPEVNLFCSIFKKENFELVVQKATECGVSKIVPIISARTIKTGLNLERLQKIAHEAAEQSGRNNVPEITEVKPLSDCLNSTGKNIFFNSSGEPLGGLTAKSEKINIFIGPEGGWTPEEISLAKSLDFKIASLGPLILRGETAAIVATYLVSNLC